MKKYFKRKDSHAFDRQPSMNRARTMFDHSSSLLTTLDAGYLVPILVKEVMPGTTINFDADFLVRVATLKKPIMDTLTLKTHAFFVPNRLLWEDFEKYWQFSQEAGQQTTAYTKPMLKVKSTYINSSLSIYDYFGVPPFSQDDLQDDAFEIDALPFRAYNKIYNDWFRDQNLQDEVPLNTTSITEDSDSSYYEVNDYQLLRKGKGYDYYTAAIPYPQKGADVSIALAGYAPVISGFDGAPSLRAPVFRTYNNKSVYSSLNWGAINPTNPNGDYYERDGGLITAGDDSYQNDAIRPLRNEPMYWRDPALLADLNATTAITINEFRQAVVVQQLYEMFARGGTRYTEMLAMVFGTNNGDARLQRSEFLGSGRTPIEVNTVANTAGNTGGNAQADLAAFAYGYSDKSDKHRFYKSFTEHGWIIVLASIHADRTYQQGLHRQFSRKYFTDEVIPHFANLGEQAILSKEIYLSKNLADNESVFGYIPRYDEMRYGVNQITGLFRSNVFGTNPKNNQPFVSLDFWHLAQDFATKPLLNEDFIVENPPVERVVVVPDEPHFLLGARFNMKTVLPLPPHSVPGLYRI